MEDLMNEYKQELKDEEEEKNGDPQIKFINGPIEMNESNEFMMIYNKKETR